MNDAELASLTAAILRACELVRTASRQDGEASSGLEAGHHEVLDALVEGPLSLSGLASRHHLELSTVSRRVTRLASLGLVAKTADPRDRRVQVVSLTELGHDTWTQVQQQRMRAVARVLETWGQDDQRALATFATRMAEQLDRGRDQPE